MNDQVGGLTFEEARQRVDELKKAAKQKKTTKPKVGKGARELMRAPKSKSEEIVRWLGGDTAMSWYDVNGKSPYPAYQHRLVWFFYSGTVIETRADDPRAIETWRNNVRILINLGIAFPGWESLPPSQQVRIRSCK